MSRLLIVQLLCALATKPRGFEGARVVYTMPQSYSPGEAEVEVVSRDATAAQLFLSSGVSGVMVVPELSSTVMQGRPTRLVFFPTFNHDQLAALLAEIQPFHLVAIHGVRSRLEDRWRLDAIRRLNALSDYPQIEEVQTDTLDYRETLKELLRIYSCYGDMDKLLISPTGSKMQTVAVGLTVAHLYDWQVIYPTPDTFAPPDEYTAGVSNTYVLDLSDFPARVVYDD